MSEILQSEETVRLYEYETYKPDLEDYIEHHGVKDMHWHVKNGPPYPLSSKLSTGSRLKKGAKGTGGSYGGNPDRLKKKKVKTAVKATKEQAKADKEVKGISKEEPKKTFKEKIHDKKVQKQRVQSLEKARQTKAENTAKKKAEAEEKEKISKMREEAIKKADIVTMYKNATHFSNEEIQAALDRKGTLDRLASEVSKSVPETTETPKKQSYIKSMVKEKTKEGLKSGAEAVVKNVATQALKMTLEQLALSASGTATNDQWDNKKKLEERRKNILRLIKA